MHNCRETKEQVTELLLDGPDGRPHEDLAAELRRCSECRAEFDVLNATLRMTTRLREAAPAEGYWIGYHARLREKLSRANTQRRKEETASSFASLRLCASTAIARFFKSSIPVPVPLAVAAIIFCSLLGLFVSRATRRQTVQLETTIVHVPVEVPVVQEKIVARVVYRERRSRPRSSKQIINGAKVETTFAKSQKPRAEDIPASLTGFKPAEEIKFTVIKGGSPNEK